ncbi:MAG TPA: sigma factor-like helix-turn-helix DNA-binding protein [Longimicrobium sp.]|jgi:hypothetical protein
MQTVATRVTRSTAAASGDRGHPLVQLFDACAPQLFALALAVSRDADAAEEAVVAAFGDAMDLSTPPTRAGMAMRVREAALARVPAERADGGPDEGRCVVELACYARLTVAEIAAELGLPPDEVKRRLAAGLRSLRPAPAAAAAG